MTGKWWESHVELIVDELATKYSDWCEKSFISPSSLRKEVVTVEFRAHGLRHVTVSWLEGEERRARGLWCMDGEGTAELVSWFLACPGSVVQIETKRAQERRNKEVVDAMFEAFREEQ